MIILKVLRPVLWQGQQKLCQFGVTIKGGDIKVDAMQKALYEQTIIRTAQNEIFKSASLQSVGNRLTQAGLRFGSRFKPLIAGDYAAK